jgi:hypothetical protein
MQEPCKRSTPQHEASFFPWGMAVQSHTTFYQQSLIIQLAKEKKIFKGTRAIFRDQEK